MWIDFWSSRQEGFEEIRDYHGSWCSCSHSGLFVRKLRKKRERHSRALCYISTWRSWRALQVQDQLGHLKQDTSKIVTVRQEQWSGLETNIANRLVQLAWPRQWRGIYPATAYLKTSIRRGWKVSLLCEALQGDSLSQALYQKHREPGDWTRIENFAGFDRMPSSGIDACDNVTCRNDGTASKW